jgi:hypothetical protein
MRLLRFTSILVLIFLKLKHYIDCGVECGPDTGIIPDEVGNRAGIQTVKIAISL